MKLAGGGFRLGAMWPSAYVNAAASANTLAAVVLKRYRSFSLFNKGARKLVKHLKERHLWGNIVEAICFEAPFALSILLAPYFEFNVHCFT